MNLYLMRHGLAESLGGKIRQDADRPLSPRGREQLKAMAERLKRKGVQFEKILTSPLLRARETAQLMLSCAMPGASLEETQALEPGTTLVKLWRFFQKQKLPEHVLAVGHMPDLGHILEALLAGYPDRSGNFSPGTVYAVHVPDSSTPSATLLWTESPD